MVVVAIASFRCEYSRKHWMMPTARSQKHLECCACIQQHSNKGHNSTPHTHTHTHTWDNHGPPYRTLCVLSILEAGADSTVDEDLVVRAARHECVALVGVLRVVVATVACLLGVSAECWVSALRCGAPTEVCKP